jgi:hypothetical protein
VNHKKLVLINVVSVALAAALGLFVYFYGNTDEAPSWGIVIVIPGAILIALIWSVTLLLDLALLFEYLDRHARAELKE